MIDLNKTHVDYEEVEENISDDYRSPQVQISMRISLELVAKCALLVKKFGLTYPNTINPSGKPVYNKFIRTVFLTLLDPYFNHTESGPPVCRSPKTDEEINAIIYQLQQGRLDQPLTFMLNSGGMVTPEGMDSLDNLVKAISEDMTTTDRESVEREEVTVKPEKDPVKIEHLSKELGLDEL